MKQIDWTKVDEANEFESVKPGGYIAQIFTVEDNPHKEYLKISLDIASGEFNGYYSKLAEAKGFWGLTLYRSYKDTALGLFKAFYRAVEMSNAGYVWNNDERTLVGKFIGIILREEEYVKNDGSIATRLAIYKVVPVIDIQQKKFKIPELKKLKIETPTPAETPEDSGNPFNR